MSEPTPGRVTPDSPTTCTYCGARLRWDGKEWMHWHGDLRPSENVEALIQAAQAQALEDAAGAWSDWDALQAPEDWLRARAAAIRDGAE